MRRHNLVAFWILTSFLAMIVLAACSATLPTEVPKSTAPAATSAPASAWDDLVKAAQKEGTVSIYGTSLAAIKEASQAAFKQKYGINLEIMEARGSELIAKIGSERRAGLYQVDLIHAGYSTLFTGVRPLGITVPLADLLISPEVTNPANWFGNKLPYSADDKQGHIISFIAFAANTIIVNTDLVREGEIGSFLDLLKPQWKGKIVLADPMVAGTALGGLNRVYQFYGEQRSMELFRQLAAQEPVISRNDRLSMDWVAKGKYAVEYGISQNLYMDFKRAGAPLLVIAAKEPRTVQSGPGSVAVFSKNPHPKATQLYVNWLLGKEGQTVWSQAHGMPSLRVDVSREGMQPANFPRDGDVYASAADEATEAKVLGIVSQIFFGK